MGKRVKIPKGVRRAVYERDHWSCHYCGRTIYPVAASQADGTHAPTAEDGVWLELDHVVPTSLGGVDAVENLRAACTPCNKLKLDSSAEADWDTRIAAAINVLTSAPASRATAQRAARLLLGRPVRLDEFGRVADAT